MIPYSRGRVVFEGDVTGIIDLLRLKDGRVNFHVVVPHPHATFNAAVYKLYGDDDSLVVELPDGVLTTNWVEPNLSSHGNTEVYLAMSYTDQIIEERAEGPR